MVFGECNLLRSFSNFQSCSISLITDIVHALSVTPTRQNTRFFAFICVTFCFVVHGTFLKFGVHLQNTLGVFKLVILSAISILGLLCLAGVPGFSVRDGYDVPDNFRWETFWEGSNKSPNAFVTGLYNVIWSSILFLRLPYPHV